MPARKDGKDMDVRTMFDWGEMWPIPSPAANSGCNSAIHVQSASEIGIQWRCLKGVG